MMLLELFASDPVAVSSLLVLRRRSGSRGELLQPAGVRCLANISAVLLLVSVVVTAVGAAIIDLEALQNFWVMNISSNWTKDLGTERFRRTYEQPIHPKNLWLEQDPLTHEPVDDIYAGNIQRLLERGMYTAPAINDPGVRYQRAATTPEQWEEIKHFWDAWGEDPQCGDTEPGPTQYSTEEASL